MLACVHYPGADIELSVPAIVKGTTEHSNAQREFFIDSRRYIRRSTGALTERVQARGASAPKIDISLLSVFW
jgi:hypothetical protein